MTTTTPSRPAPSTPIAAAPGPAGLPWPALLVLGAATMVMVTGEMLPTALLNRMSAGLGVSEASAGLLVSIWALVVVVASFPLVRLTRRWDPTAVITGSLLAFAASATLTGAATAYPVAVTGRVLGAAAVGLLWATVNAHVASLVPDRLLGRATAIVLGGATLGMVLGTPLGRLIADLAGWRTSFAALAVAAVVTAAAVRVVVPPRPARGGDEGGGAVARGGLRPVVAVTGLVALVLVGHYGAYTFVTRLVERPADLLPGGMATALLAFGLASAAGVVVAGRVGERTGPALVVATAATAAAVLGLGLADQRPAAGLVVLLGWGTASGALPPLAQTMILRLAGAEHRELAGALIPVVFNGGIAVGAAAAAGLVAASGPASLPPAGAVLVALGALGLALVARPRRTAAGE